MPALVVKPVPVLKSVPAGPPGGRRPGPRRAGLFPRPRATVTAMASAVATMMARKPLASAWTTPRASAAAEEPAPCPLTGTVTRQAAT